MWSARTWYTEEKGTVWCVGCWEGHAPDQDILGTVLLVRTMRTPGKGERHAEKEACT